MTKFVREGSAWEEVLTGGYHVKSPTDLKQVDEAWVWDGTTWKKYYTKAFPVEIHYVVNSWERITVSWNTIAPGSLYTLKRNGIVLVNQSNVGLHVDNLLMPGSSNTYVVEAYLGGKLMSTATTGVVMTPAYPDLGLTATTASYSQINLAWSPETPADSSIDNFLLIRDGAGPLLQGMATAYNDTGLVPGTGYGYTLHARRGATVIKTDTASATTSVRPTSSGSWNGPAATTSGGWTSCTARSLNGPTFPMPVNGYITSWNVLVWSYGSATGQFNPHIGGQYRGLRNCPGGRAYQNVDGGNIYIGAGNNSTGANIGGNCSYSTEWDAYSGVAWNYNVAVGTINYWYYTALARETMGDQPWWTDELEERSTHMETWGVGEITKVQITDKVTRSIIVDWQSDDHDESLYN